MIAAIAVPLNTIFGVLCALAIVRHRFPGKGLLNAVVDLPLALSPVVVGLALVLLYGRDGWLGGLACTGSTSSSRCPAMVLATIFVSLPFVVREVVPVLREIGTDQEQAAATLGARAVPRPSAASRCRRSAGRSPTASCSRPRARSASSAPSASSPGTIEGKTRDADAATSRSSTSRLRHHRRVRRLRRARADRDRRRSSLLTIFQPQGGALDGHRGRRRDASSFGDFVALDDVSVDVPERLADGAARPERQRQVDAAARDRRARAARLRRGVHLGDEDVTPAGPQQRGVGFVFQHYAAFKHMTVADNVAFGLTIRKRPEGGDPSARARAARARPARRARQALPGAALGRPAAADGARPRARGRAGGAAARRAVRRARRARAQGAARLAAPPPRRGARDDGLRHARPGGGDGGRRPDRGHERGPGRADRLAARALRAARRTSS